jgi:hypothetical protein
VTLQIDENQISSPDTPHTAIRITHSTWLVTWLRKDHRLTRTQAITAMTIASTVGASKGQLVIKGPSAGPVDKSDPIWGHLAAWAAELGLDATVAVLSAAATPKWSNQ